MRSQRGAFWLTTVARLKPGVRLAQARREMDAISRRLATQHTQERGLGVELVTLKDELTATTRPALLVLTAAVAFVLLMACVNVAGMLVARASDRQGEITLRTALGAGRGRVIRQLLTEATLLFVMGGTLGLALAAAGVQAIVRLAPEALTQIRDVEVDWTVALYAVGVAAVAGLVFGAAPAVHAARRDQADALRGGARTIGRRGGAWFRSGLLAAQVALAFVLLTGAALFLRSFAEMQAVDLGFDPRGVVAARISLPGARYDSATRVVAFYEALVERLRAAPGVESAAGISSLLLGRLPTSARFQIEGRTQDVVTPLTYDTVTPGFFRAMRIPLLRGRFFTDADGSASERVTIVNQTTANEVLASRRPGGPAHPLRRRRGQQEPVADDRRRGGRHQARRPRRSGLHRVVSAAADRRRPAILSSCSVSGRTQPPASRPPSAPPSGRSTLSNPCRPSSRCSRCWTRPSRAAGSTHSS